MKFSLLITNAKLKMNRIKESVSLKHAFFENLKYLDFKISSFVFLQHSILPIMQHQHRQIQPPTS